MLAMKALRFQLGELLAADDTTLAPAADNNVVALMMETVAVNENLTPDDLDLATFTGATPKLAGLGTQQAGIDPATGQQRVTILEPAGGWRWETTDAVNLPQTIYGFALLNEALDELYGVQLLDTPVVLTAAGQEINIGTVAMKIVQQPLS